MPYSNNQTHSPLSHGEGSGERPTFLELVAQDLHSKIGNDLSRVAIVFPNKRASLFFNEHLAAQSDRPIWSPAYISISELFQQLSVQKLGDPIRLVCELYKVFREETKSEESLDDFYFWGELLISDFDDVDKNLVDADKLFTNLQDLKNIMDDFDFLDEEQESAIRQFFQNFSIEKHTELKEKFISLWDKLGDIYRNYRSRLTTLGIAYEGMLYRNVIEALDTDTLRYDKYVFVGFNVLNTVETRFVSILKDASKALFYWDYDIFYTRLSQQKHEAGEFILRNMKLFPNELPEEVFDCLRHPKKVRFISSPTENAQARYLPEWVRGLAREHSTPDSEKENAVVHIFETDSLESIEYKEASGEEMSFVKEDDTWEYAPDTTIALTESSMQNMEDAFSDIQAVKEIKNPDGLSDYGFDSPEYNLTLTGKDGEAHKFLIGNASGENYYFMEDGTEKVYTVSADLISEMVWQLADVAEKDSFVTVTSDNFVKETVTKPGDEVKTYEADNEDQEDTVTSIMTALSGFYFTDCADYHVTDATLGNYGLAEDQRTKVELTYKDTSDDDKEKTVTFYVGSKDDSATYYYVQMDGSQRVSRVLIDTVEKALGWKVDSSAE